MFHQISLLFFYKSICYAFIANASIIRAELREKIQKYRFFILYNNMNFYKRMRNAQMFNQRAQINYIIGYISFIKPINVVSNLYWQNQYLLTFLVNCTKVNCLCVKNFILLLANLYH